MRASTPPLSCFRVLTARLCCSLFAAISRTLPPHHQQALKQQKHEPHKPGPTVITTSTSTVQSTLLLQQQANSNARSSSSTSTSRPLSFGAAPHGAAAASTAGSSNAHNSPNSSSSYESLDFDVVMCGGTLGICVALALQQKGFRVAVVEKRRVEGRLQEWNTSRHEVQVRGRTCCVRVLNIKHCDKHCCACMWVFGFVGWAAVGGGEERGAETGAGRIGTKCMLETHSPTLFPSNCTPLLPPLQKHAHASTCLQVLVDMGLLSQSELEAAIKSEFKPIRVGE